MRKLQSHWEVVDNKKLHKVFATKTFIDSMNLANRIAEVAEMEKHHPDIHISYHAVNVDIWTHAIGGLSESDFILASKIELLSDG